MPETKTCPLCKQEVEALEFELHERVDRVTLDWIKRDHPDWVEEDGSCPRCLELFRKMKEREAGSDRSGDPDDPG